MPFSSFSTHLYDKKVLILKPFQKIFNFCHLSFDTEFGVALPKVLSTLFLLFLTKHSNVQKLSAEFQTGIIYE